VVRFHACVCTEYLTPWLYRCRRYVLMRCSTCLEGRRRPYLEWLHLLTSFIRPMASTVTSLSCRPQSPTVSRASLIDHRYDVFMCARKSTDNFHLPPTHGPYLPLLPSCRASPLFGWYSLCLPAKGWPG